MRITVFGATGGIGGQIVRQALEAGHKVTAVVRSAFEVTHPSLEVVRVPGLDAADPLREAVDASAAVISGVGPRGRKDGPVASRSTKSILAAMEATGVRRFVAVSAAPLGPIPADESFLNRRILYPAINWSAADVYADLRVMEADIASSRTEWTIVRPPKLTDKALTGQYRTVVGGTVPRTLSVSRADVAHLMLAVLDDPATIGQPIGVGC
ncbi:NAD(P)H-binding protein [Kribbella sp. NPDC048915]|uniref:NAD(P)-dependent oxidoreductase n=1 Tax=Kribbella sp. NPDC048915 TaxID=3155148 RepID=UPI003410B8F3